MTFRKITRNEAPSIAHIFRPIIEAEEFISLPRGTSDAEWTDFWFGDTTYEVWIAEEDGKVLGTFHLRPNQKGLGSHVANGGYLVAPEARGRGIGRQMCEQSIARARELGYRAIQFNFVISTNTTAVNLWKDLGFRIIGTIPDGYHRKQQEYVDAHIMFRDLA